MKNLPRIPRSQKLSRGFSLIELMIAVAIVSILVAVAYPAYNSYIDRGHRAAAQAVMMDIVNKQQQYLLDRRAYTDDVSDLGIAIPADVSSRYTITIEADNDAPPTFTVSAAPAGVQSDDKCGTMTIDNASVKSPSDCW